MKQIQEDITLVLKKNYKKTTNIKMSPIKALNQ